MNRLELKLQQLSVQQKSGLVCYFTAGDPDFETSLNLLSQVGASGADIIEIGMPFSDPIADGEIIQAAHMRALASGQTLQKTLYLIERIREKDQHTPIVLMGYLNPIMQYGLQNFIQDAHTKVDALLIVDLPFEYHHEYEALLNLKHIQMIRMTTPNTDQNRLNEIAENAKGFIYHVAANGVTGLSLDIHATENSELDHHFEQKMLELKCTFKIPVGVGFGIKTQQQVKKLAGKADLIIIGSVLVETLMTHGISEALNKIREFAQILKTNQT